VEDSVDPLDELEQRVLRQVCLEELEGRTCPSLSEIRVLERTRIVVREGIDAEDLVASLEERFDEVRADEPGAARYEVPADGASS